MAIDTIDGVDLRDYFACHIIAAIMQNGKLMDYYSSVCKTPGFEIQEYAAFTAYRYADAMIQQRNKKK